MRRIAHLRYSVAVAALLLVLGWVMAHWGAVWLSRAAAEMAPSTTAGSAAPVVDLHKAVDTVMQAGLFHAPAMREPPARAPLAITLVGVLAALGREPSYAVLNVENQGNELYAEGARLAPEVELHRVARDHVVIRRLGRLERIEFPRESRPEAHASSPPPAQEGGTP